MKLQRIELTNFRQYLGVQKLEFARDPLRNVTVVNGLNGAGKTGLFMALNWCLYGRDALSANIGDLVNKYAIAEVPIGHRVETRVSLWFHHSGSNYLAQRSNTYTKHGSMHWTGEDKDTFKLNRIRAAGTVEEVRNATGVIEHMLSSAVRTYFFFDGEKIERFASPEHASEVKEAVRKVLRIEVLERTRNHLDGLAKELQRLLREEASGKLQELQAQEASARTAKENAEVEAQATATEIKRAHQQIRAYDQRLLEVTRVQGAVEQRQVQELRYREKDLEKDGVEEEISALASMGYVALAAQVCSASWQAIEDRRQRGEVPSGFREQFLKDLLAQMTCICDRPLEPGTLAYDHVAELLQRAVPAKLEDVLLQSAVELKVVANRAEEIPAGLRSKLERRKHLEQELQVIYEDIDELTREIGKSAVEDAAKLERNRQEAQERQQMLYVRQGVLQQQIVNWETELNRLNREIREQTAKTAHVERLRRKYNLARTAADAVAGIFETFAADMRQTIQREAQGIFQRLVWKQSQFREISLSSDYHLEILDRWGLPARTELSAGERQVLSLAFITGMARVSGEEAPLVMDTPFGRLSSAHRENISAHLPEITSQLIVLVQDLELLGSARKALEPRIGAEYELVFDQATGCTSIQEASGG